MTIDKVLAVYSVSPPLLVLESDEGKVFELSLKEIKDASLNVSDAVWNSLIDDYQLFRCRRVPH